MDAGDFGPFVLIEPLARGGMGEVWLARRFGLRGIADLVVVKVTRADQKDASEARQRFRDETKIAMLLAHPSIARTVDAGRVQDMEYLALEAVDGVNLVELDARMRARHEPMPDAVALYIAASVLDALSFAHTACHPITDAPLHVVHRDMSPHNVMVASNGTVKVIDFGVALSSLKEAHTEQGIVIGKMAYMAPEQARGDAIDARADVFAVAVLLYELLAGERFYPNMTPDAVWRVAGTGQYRPPALARFEADVRRVLERALAPDPVRRTQTAAAMRAEVAALLMVRGGATAAARALAALVHRHAAAEVARIARARVAAQQAHQPNEDTTTESIASAEGLAIEAALRTRVEEPVTVRLESYAQLPEMTPPRPRPAVAAESLTPLTMAIAHQAPRTTERVRAPRRSKVPWVLAGVAALAAATLGGFVLGTQRGAATDVALVTARPDAGASGASSVDAGVRASVDAGAPVAVLDPPPPPPPPPDVAPPLPPKKSAHELRIARVLLDARALKTCALGCAKKLQSLTEEKVRDASDSVLGSMEKTIERCRNECGR